VLAFAVTFALLLLEIRLRRAQAADQEMRQARLVWVDAREEVSPSLVDPREEILRSADHFTITARPVVHNDSDETIRVLFVRVYDEFDQHLGVALAPGAALSPHSEVECLPLSVDVPRPPSMQTAPLRPTAVEQRLASGASIADAAHRSAEATDPPSDLNGSSEYRKHLARVALEAASG
jgi:hypothetical protein